MCHSARGPDLTLPNIGQQLGDIRIQRIRSFQKCSLGEIPPNEFIAFCKIILWSLMIFNDLRKKKTCKINKLCNHLIKVKHYVLRFSKNFMSLPWRSMVVHLAPIPFTSYFHYDHFTRLKKESTTKKEAGQQVHVSQNHEIQESICFPVLQDVLPPIETVKATLCHPQAERHLDPIGSGFRDQRYLKTCWDDGFSLRWRLGQACFV